MYKTTIEKAEALREALPYIKKFAGATIVIKYGGAAMVDKSLQDGFASDATLLKHIGINPIVVHGGGPQIGLTLKKMGITTEFVEGLRVTNEEAIDVVEMVLVGKVNKEIVARINAAGGKAVGLSGKDGNLIKAKKLFVERLKPEFNRPEIIDIGMVGEVVSIDTKAVDALEMAGYIPVIAPVGFGDDKNTYNINADFVAAAIAGALKAAKLILMTDTEGVLDKDKNLIRKLSEREITNLMRDGTICGGMKPKVDSCLKALKSGVKQTHIIDGRIKCAALLEIFTDQGVGTEISA